MAPAVLLSGGFDSSAVAGVAAGIAHREGAGVPRAYTCRFHRHSSCDELEYSSAVCDLHGIEQVHVDCDDCWTLWDVPDFLPTLVEPLLEQFWGTADLAMAHAAADGRTSVMWGHGGDAVTFVGAAFVAGWVLRGRLADARRELRGQATVLGQSYARRVAAGVVFPLAPATLRDRVVRRISGLGGAPWLSPAMAARAQAPRPSSSGPDAWWYDLHAMLTDSGLGPVGGTTDRRERRLGVRLEAPFIDERVFDFSLRMAPDAHYRGGKMKMLFRDALGDDYPPIVRDRLGKASLEPLAHEGMRERRPGLVRALAQDSLIAQRGWVDEKAWCAGVDRYMGGDDSLRIGVWQGLTLELWLRSDGGRRPDAVPLSGESGD